MNRAIHAASTLAITTALAWSAPGWAEVTNEDNQKADRAQAIVVTADRDKAPETGLLSAPIVETPFSVTALDEELFENLNARQLSQILRFDPSVQNETDDAGYTELINIRGFALAQPNFQYAGLPGLVPYDGRYNVANIERIDLFRGVNTLVAASSPFGGIGGSINFVPKTPLDQPLTELSFGYDTVATGFIQTDISRRFADDRVGVRFNAFLLEGDGAVRNFERSTTAITMNMDFRVTPTLTLRGEYGLQNDTLRGYRDNIGIGALTRVPEPPRSSDSYAQPWSRLPARNQRWFASANWEPAEGWGLEAAYGQMRSTDDYLCNFSTFVNDLGDIDIACGAQQNSRFPVNSATITGRGRIKTGPIEHRLVVAHAWFDQTFSSSFAPFDPIRSNIFDPVDVPPPTLAPAGAPFIADISSRTLTVMDDLRIAEILSVLVGFRHTELTSFGNASGEATTPIAAVTGFLAEGTTLYASFAKGLEAGGRAGIDPTITNPGVVLPPGETRQIEIGGKYQAGPLLLTAAVFDTRRPLEFFQQNSDGTRTFVQSGRQVHRGFELRSEGSVTPNLRVLGGITYIDARIRDNGNPVQAGNRPAAVPEFRTSIYAEYDVPMLSGFTAIAGLVTTSGAFLEIDNRLRVDDWWRLDIGARYAFKIGDTPLVARVNIDNVTNRDYWVAANGSLSLSTPRALRSSLTVAF